MKLIQRHLHGLRSANISAGVYTTTTVIPLKAKFNILVNYLQYSLVAYDNVTSQLIRCGGYYRSDLPDKSEQPAITVANYEDDPYLCTGNGASGEMKLNKKVSAGQLWNSRLYMFLETVTANPIAYYISFNVGYLCPEDYLSVEPFDINPETAGQV